MTDSADLTLHQKDKPRYAEGVHFKGIEKYLENYVPSVVEKKDRVRIKIAKRDLAKKKAVAPSELLGITHEKRKESEDALAESLRDQWDSFSRDYTDNGTDTKKLETVNALHDIAFGKCASQYINKSHALKTRTGFQKFKDNICDVCADNSSRLKKKKNGIDGPIDLNRALNAVFIEQWIKLRQELPIKDLKKALEAFKKEDEERTEDRPIKDKTRETKLRNIRNEALSKKHPGILIKQALWALNKKLTIGSLISGLRLLPTTSMKDPKEIDNLAYIAFERALFAYSPNFDADFSTFVRRAARFAVFELIHPHKQLESLNRRSSSAREEEWGASLEDFNNVTPINRDVRNDAQRELAAHLTEAIATLTPVQQQAVKEYIGLDGQEPRTFEEIGGSRQNGQQAYQRGLKGIAAYLGPEAEELFFGLDPRGSSR